MNISFTAIKTDFEDDEYALIVGFDGIESSLSFQRDSEQSFEDFGLYLQFGEQQNGEYECVSVCRVIRTKIEVVLSRQLGMLEGVSGFEVELDIDNDSYARSIAGLLRVFRDMPGCLQIN